MRRTVLFLRGGEGEPARVVVERRGSSFLIVDGGRTENVDVARLPDGRVSLILDDGRQFSGRGDDGADGVRVSRPGRSTSVPMTRTRLSRSRLVGDSREGGTEEIRALMHGRIVEVRVATGDRVEEGALLLVLEAMKMQNEIRASRAGTIERAQVAPGQTVEGGAFLLSIRSDNN
jgi:biotin carboxyl carrier protein